MDEENSRQLTEAIRELSESVAMLTYNLTGNKEAIEKETSARKADTAEINAGTESRRKLTKEELEALSNLKRASHAAVDSLKEFGSALGDTSGGFGKYERSIGSLGDAAASVAKNLPGIGQAAAIAIQGLTLFGKTALKQVDNMIKGFNEMAEVGVVGQLGVESIRNLAKEAGYSTKNMKGFTDAFKSMGPGMIALGGSASDAAKSFGNLTKLNKEEIDHYRRLGMSQEQFTQAQADAVKYLTKSGVTIDENMKKDGRLRAATKDYVDSLQQLSALTGESVESMKKQKEQALANTAVQVHLYQLNKKEADLRAAGKGAEAEKVAQERKRTEEMLTLAKGRMSAEQFAGFQKMVATGQFTKESAAFARSNPEILAVIKEIKEGRQDPAMLAKELQKGQDRMMDQAGEAAKYSDEAAKALNLSVESQQAATQVRGQTDEQYAKSVAEARERQKMTEAEAKAKIAALEKELKNEKDPEKRKALEAQITDLKRGPQVDETLDAQNKRMNLERDLSLALDDAVLAFNPFTSTLGMATAAVGALAAAAGIAAYSMGKGSALQKGLSTVADVATKAGPSLGTMATTAANVGTKLAGAAGPIAAVTAVAAGTYKGYTGYQEAKEAEEKGEITKEEATVKKSEAVGEGVGTAGGGVGGALAGAAAGAAIGSVVPILGTAIGGVIGAAVGGLGGSAIGGWLGKKAGGGVGELIKGGEAKPEAPVARPAGTAAAAEKKEALSETVSRDKQLSDAFNALTDSVKKTNGAFTTANTQLANVNTKFKKFDEQLKESLGEDVIKPDELTESLTEGLETGLNIATAGMFGRTQKLIEQAMQNAGAAQAGVAQGATTGAPVARGTKTYTVNGKPATKQEYDSAMAQMQAQVNPPAAGPSASPFTISRPKVTGGTMPVSTVPEPPPAQVAAAPAAAKPVSSGPPPAPKYDTPPTIRATAPATKTDSMVASAIPEKPADTGTKTPSGKKPDLGDAQVAAADQPDSKGPPGGKFKDKEEFIKVMMPWAEYASKALGGAPVLGILGQWAGESGAGKNLPADFNYAGIKAGNKFQKGDYVLTEERYNQKQLDRAIKSGESLASILENPNDTIKKKGKDVTIDQWYGAGAFQKAQDAGLNWVQVKSHFAKFNDLKDFTDGYVGFLKNPRYAEALKAGTAEDFGYNVAKAGYATASADKYAKKVGSFADGIKAAAGGIAQGPSTGYPVTMHGKELITPLNPNSLLEKLANTPANDIIRQMMPQSNMIETKAKDENFEVLANINSQMLEMMEKKFDDLIDKISSGNDIQNRILKHSAA